MSLPCCVSLVGHLHLNGFAQTQQVRFVEVAVYLWELRVAGIDYVPAGELCPVSVEAVGEEDWDVVDPVVARCRAE